MAKHTLHILNARDVSQMSSEEIRTLIADLKQANMTFLAKVKSQNMAIEHPSRIKENKRMIARGMTILIKRGERCV